MTDTVTQNHAHAWRGAWDRPMLMDEDSMHPFDVARMTDHNVRGNDRLVSVADKKGPAVDRWENEGGVLAGQADRPKP